MEDDPMALPDAYVYLLGLPDDDSWSNPLFGDQPLLEETLLFSPPAPTHSKQLDANWMQQRPDVFNADQTSNSQLLPNELAKRDRIPGEPTTDVEETQGSTYYCLDR
ncbi:hypothetical protein HDU77_010519, partial [Chytriomyces hyalinus]